MECEERRHLSGHRAMEEGMNCEKNSAAQAMMIPMETGGLVTLSNLAGVFKRLLLKGRDNGNRAGPKCFILQ